MAAINRKIGGACTIAIGLATFVYLVDLGFWVKSPANKFESAWKHDVELLRQSDLLPNALNDLAEIEFISNEPRLHDWYQKASSPLKTSSTGKYKLQILGMHWIEGYRYGVMLQYNWISLKSGDTIGEIGRTLRLGFVY